MDSISREHALTGLRLEDAVSVHPGAIVRERRGAQMFNARTDSARRTDAAQRTGAAPHAIPLYVRDDSGE